MNFSLSTNRLSQRPLSVVLLCCVFVLTSTIPSHMGLHAIDSVHLDAEIKQIIKGYQLPEFLKHDHGKSGLLSAEKCDFCFVSNALDGGLIALHSLAACLPLFSIDVKRVETTHSLLSSIQMARGPPSFS